MFRNEGISDDDLSVEISDDDDDDENSEPALTPEKIPLLRTPMTQTHPSVRPPSHAPAALEESTQLDHLFEVNTCPTIIGHVDLQMVKHYQVRWVPPQGVVSWDEEELGDGVFPKLVWDGLGLELKFKYPAILYDLSDACKLECWDKIWGESACMGKSAMFGKSLKIKDEFEQQDSVWAVQKVEFEEPMDLIESFHLEAHGLSRCVVICLKGPDSSYKKRKLTEDAVCSKAASCAFSKWTGDI